MREDKTPDRSWSNLLHAIRGSITATSLVDRHRRSDGPGGRGFCRALEPWLGRGLALPSTQAWHTTRGMSLLDHSYLQHEIPAQASSTLHTTGATPPRLASRPGARRQ